MEIAPALLFVFIYMVAPSTIDLFPGFVYDTFPMPNWQHQLNSFISMIGALAGTLGLCVCMCLCVCVYVRVCACVCVYV
jgi:hypothetical protein